MNKWFVLFILLIIGVLLLLAIQFDLISFGSYFAPIVGDVQAPALERFSNYNY